MKRARERASRRFLSFVLGCVLSLNLRGLGIYIYVYIALGKLLMCNKGAYVITILIAIKAVQHEVLQKRLGYL